MKNKHYAYESPFKMKDNDGKEYLLTIENYEFAESPREWDTLCTMVCWHRHYSLGDKHNYDGIEDFFQTLCKEILNKSYDETDKLYWTDMFKMLKESNLIAIKAINAYEHGGITISTSNSYPYNDRWDAGCVGFIYATKQKIFDECGDITEENWEEKADQYIENEIQVYDQYLRGECYRFTLEEKVHYRNETTCPHCGEVIKVDEYDDYEEVDSCCGFYGDCIEENGIIDCLGDLKFEED